MGSGDMEFLTVKRLASSLMGGNREPSVVLVRRLEGSGSQLEAADQCFCVCRRRDDVQKRRQKKSMCKGQDKTTNANSPVDKELKQKGTTLEQSEVS